MVLLSTVNKFLKTAISLFSSSYEANFLNLLPTQSNIFQRMLIYLCKKQDNNIVALGNYFPSALGLWIMVYIMLLSCLLWTESRTAQYCGRCQKDTPPHSRWSKNYLLCKLKRITEWFVLQLICRTSIFNFQCQSGAFLVHKVAYCSPRKWKEERLLANTCAHLCWLNLSMFKHTILISSISIP